MPLFARLRRSMLFLAACAAAAGCTQQDTECLARIGSKFLDRSHGAMDKIRAHVEGDLKVGPHTVVAPAKEMGLKEKIETRIRWDALLADTKIDVQVSGTEVELKGIVRNDAQRRRAGDLAETTAGVQAVNDALTVEEK